MIQRTWTHWHPTTCCCLKLVQICHRDLSAEKIFIASAVGSKCNTWQIFSGSVGLKNIYHTVTARKIDKPLSLTLIRRSCLNLRWKCTSRKLAIRHSNWSPSWKGRICQISESSLQFNNSYKTSDKIRWARTRPWYNVHLTAVLWINLEFLLTRPNNMFARTAWWETWRCQVKSHSKETPFLYNNYYKYN